MKNFIKEYLRVFAYAAIGFVFIISSFYLLINYYHSEELKNTIYFSTNSTSYINHKNTLDQINTNLINFKNKKSTNKNLNNMSNQLSTCVSVLKDEGSFYNLNNDTNLSYIDVYKLGSNFQNNVLNHCWILNLSNFLEDTPNEFKTIMPYVENSINLINNQINFSLDEIENNGSYFYTTGVTSITIRNSLASDYRIIVNSYQELANIILELSNYINELETTGGNLND